MMCYYLNVHFQGQSFNLFPEHYVHDCIFGIIDVAQV